MTILNFILVWFLISIPCAMVVGRILEGEMRRFDDWGDDHG